MKKAITFRLRAGLDDDLAEAIKNLDPKELSEKARNGLRLMLGITTAPTTTVVSRSILPPTPQEQLSPLAQSPQQTTTTPNPAPSLQELVEQRKLANKGIDGKPNSISNN